MKESNRIISFSLVNVSPGGHEYLIQCCICVGILGWCCLFNTLIYNGFGKLSECI